MFASCILRSAVCTCTVFSAVATRVHTHAIHLIAPSCAPDCVCCVSSVLCASQPPPAAQHPSQTPLHLAYHVVLLYQKHILYHCSSLPVSSSANPIRSLFTTPDVITHKPCTVFYLQRGIFNAIFFFMLSRSKVPSMSFVTVQYYSFPQTHRRRWNIHWNLLAFRRALQHCTCASPISNARLFAPPLASNW